MKQVLIKLSRRVVLSAIAVSAISKVALAWVRGIGSGGGGGFVDDLAVTDWIDDNSIASPNWIDDNGVTG